MRNRFGILLALLCLALGAVTAAHAEPLVYSVTNFSLTAYVINGDQNPDLTLVKGRTYTFNVSAPGHPFWIKTVQGTGTGNAYNSGVTGNGTSSGTITFTVPSNAPSTLYYNCQFHPDMTGQITVLTPAPAVSPLGVAALALLVASLGGVVLRRRAA